MNATSLPENWRDVPGYEGAYEVSDLGRVRSLDRFIAFDHPTRPGLWRRGRMRRTPVGNHGYPTVSLTCTRHRQRARLVHRLVLEAFVGPCPPGMEACHNNGDRTDSRLVNLRWDTSTENNRDTVRHGRSPGKLKTRCPRRHLLVAPNLRAREARVGNRSCLACSRAAARVSRLRKRGFTPDRDAIADFEYAKITAGLPAYASGRGRRAAPLPNRTC